MTRRLHPNQFLTPPDTTRTNSPSSVQANLCVRKIVLRLSPVASIVSRGAPRNSIAKLTTPTKRQMLLTNTSLGFPPDSNTLNPQPNPTAPTASPNTAKTDCLHPISL